MSRPSTFLVAYRHASAAFDRARIARTALDYKFADAGAKLRADVTMTAAARTLKHAKEALMTQND